MILPMIQFNSFLMVNRILRSDFDLGIFEAIKTAANYFFSSAIDLSGYEEAFQKTAHYLGFIMRINGADSLLNILYYDPPFSFERIGYLLFKSTETMNVLYASHVLGYSVDQYLSFSPSLLGYFTFPFSNTALVCIAMVVYTLVWHFLFSIILNARFFVKPIALALLIVILGTTSEGTLEAMPRSIAIVMAIVICAELGLRFFLGTGILRSFLVSHNKIVTKNHL